MNRKIILGCFVLFILVLSSCYTTTKIPEKIRAYEFPTLEPKDYIILAPIILKADISGKNFPELTIINGRLMEEAIKLGGHDVINVRYDYTSDGRVVSVTAIAIKYINDVVAENSE